VGLEDRLSSVLHKQFALIQEMRSAHSEVAAVRSRLQMRIAELEEQERHARIQHEEAVAEEDPQAEAIREWPERTRARIEELRASVAELATAEELVSERIRAAERAVEDFRVLQPQLVARVAAARNAGVSREVFDTLNDALNYVELVLGSATDEDPNGPLRPA
jgi:DNA repair exonuclease SbcCD ATPase subunit